MPPDQYRFILSFFQIQNQRTSNIAEESVINDEDVDAENSLPDLDITQLIDPFRTRINISTMKITIQIFIQFGKKDMSPQETLELTK